MTIVPIIKRDYITKLGEQGKRIDGRSFDQYRNIEIETNVVNKAEGSARVKIGNTQVLCGIKMDIGEPFPDTPITGVMSTAAEFIPLASPDFESGPPREDAIELARVVDRGVRESQVIQLEKLCITPGEKVWLVFIDIHILDYDGNLFDAASLAALAALLTTKVPVSRFLKELNENDRNSWQQKLLDLYTIPGVDEVPFGASDTKNNLQAINDFPLPMIEPPISCTAVKINDFVFFDPCFDEEVIADARLTVATDHKGDIRAMQKGLSGSFTRDEIQKVIKGALDNGQEIRKTLNQSIGK
ncbi:MAG TPA: exosome complex protein Rrp42 [Thermoplasmata archaeon]|jgi:exosome complex component RRP42|nr:exosome complex protein Rrp42 [Thermoplasmata archaeon]